jgi:hypothetical protein
MGRIKDWWDSLSTGWVVFIYTILGIAICTIAESFLGERYEKFYPNSRSYTEAVQKFKAICGYDKYTIEDMGDGVEYTQYYDVEEKAKGDFFALVYSLDEIYANGNFFHYYLFGSDKIYQCHDRHERLIAVKYAEFDGYEGDYYEIKLFIEH